MAEQQEVEGVEVETLASHAEHWEKLLAEEPGGDASEGNEEDVDPEVEVQADGDAKPKVIEKKRWTDLERLNKNMPVAARERIAKRFGAVEQQSEAQRLQQELAAERARLQEVQTREAQQDAKFRELFEAGRIDEALKVKGVSATLGDMSRQLLAHKTNGGIAGKDPRVDQLEGRLQSFLDAQQKAEQQARQAELQRQQAAIAQEEASALAEEIASLPYEGAEALKGLPGFVDSVYGDMVQSRGTADVETAVRRHRDNYQELFKQLWQAAKAGALEFPSDDEEQHEKPSKRQAQARSAPVSIPRNGKSPKAALPERLRHNSEERWQAIMDGKL